MGDRWMRSTVRRLILPAVGLAVGGFAVVGVATATASGFGQEDPGVAVGEIALPVPVDAPDPQPPPDVAAGSVGQADLTTLAGVLETCGRDLCVNGIVVDLGPAWYLGTADAPADLDGDGDVETVSDEAAGRVGTSVDLAVEYGRGGEAEVFAVDGVFFRNEIGPPPWAGIRGSR